MKQQQDLSHLFLSLGVPMDLSQTLHYCVSNDTAGFPMVTWSIDITITRCHKLVPVNSLECAMIVITALSRFYVQFIFHVLCGSGQMPFHLWCTYFERGGIHRDFQWPSNSCDLEATEAEKGNFPRNWASAICHVTELPQFAGPQLAEHKFICES